MWTSFKPDDPSFVSQNTGLTDGGQVLTTFEPQTDESVPVYSIGKSLGVGSGEGHVTIDVSGQILDMESPEAYVHITDDESNRGIEVVDYGLEGSEPMPVVAQSDGDADEDPLRLDLSDTTGVLRVRERSSGFEGIPILPTLELVDAE